MRRAARRRIGFDAGALSFPAGGVRRYARELLAVLPEAADAQNAAVEFVALGLPGGVFLPDRIRRGPRVASLPNNLARAVLSLPWAIRRARVDLFHAPAYTAPLAGGTATVLTIHDVSYARRPEFYAYRADPLRQWFYRRSALVATHIITDSDFSRREIVAAYRIAEERITVVPLGVGAPFGPARDPGGDLYITPDPSTWTRETTAPGADGPGRRGTGVRRPYLLHVGDLHPRRNLEWTARIIVGLNRLRAMDGRTPLQLVCVGRDAGSAHPVRAVFEAARTPEDLCLVGPVPESDLVAMYQAAAVFVYPSLYEGFGLPVLEAMACGAPVVALRAGSIPEVVGDAGLLVAEGDDRGFAAALEAVVDSPARSRALRDAGLARAATFTWANTGRATLAVYLRCLTMTTG